jgi:hypothetical protein
MPFTPISLKASFTASNREGWMIASTFVMVFYLSSVSRGASKFAEFSAPPVPFPPWCPKRRLLVCRVSRPA